MQAGAMNNPHANVYKELEWIGKAGFDFVDFTIEPEKTMPKDIDIARAKKIMKKHGLGIVGHMGDWMLPKDIGYRLVREAAKKEIILTIKTLRKLGARKVTIHSPRVTIKDYGLSKRRHADAVKAALSEAKKQKMTLMLENNADYIEEPENKRLLHYLLKRFPSLKLHIDVGHSNICVKRNETYHLMRKYGKRVEHFHLSDNMGEEDDHLKLGAGNIDWKRVITFLKNKGYDGTITLEVFRSGKQGEKDSLKKLRRLWQAA